jgi:type 1 glutamine amidotransferase
LKVLVACSKGQLAAYEQYLQTNYHVRCTWMGDDGAKGAPKVLTGVDGLGDCDVLLLNLYRTTPGPEDLKAIQQYFQAGRPVVGLRKASHSFQNWVEADRIVFGARYGGHFFKDRKAQTVFIEDRNKEHPLVKGFQPFMCGGGLYNYTQLAPEVEVLMSGGPPGEFMPVTWTRIHKETRGRIFYTRYDPNDLKNDEGCRQLVARALFWAADRDQAAYKK